MTDSCNNQEQRIVTVRNHMSNLREFYPVIYKEDHVISLPDEVIEVLLNPDGEISLTGSVHTGTKHIMKGK